MTPRRTGADVLCTTLAGLGVDTVFGLPGTQTVWLYEALRASSLRTVVSTHELGATFMAIGYYRSSGRVAAVSTIPGPGFMYALTGLAEARFDSAALLLIVVKPRPSRGARFRFQDIDHEALAAPAAKGFVRIESAGDIEAGLHKAYRTAVDGEPGPVVVEVQAEALEAGVTGHAREEPAVVPPARTGPDVDALCEVLSTAGRCVLLVGQGAAAASDAVVRLAERLDAIVVATSSGRGIVPEDHRCALPIEYSIHDVRVMNDLCRAADVVLALGCKLGHNGAAGFRLELPAEKFLHVDASPDVVGGNYEARVGLVADVPAAVDAILAGLGPVTGRAAPTVRPATHQRAAEGLAGGWTDEERESWRNRAASARTLPAAPTVAGAKAGMAEVLGALRARTPRDTCLVTDSGLHQMVTRTWWTVLAPRSLVTPADFQSMGFGLPAAIGAAIASPQRRIVCVIGDGGLAMSGMELATAVREGVRLLVVVCNDGGFGLIRRQQVLSDTPAFAVDFASPDIGLLAVSLGAEAARWQGADALDRALDARGVFVLELALRDHPDQVARGRRQRAKAAVRRLVGPSTIERLRRWLPGSR